MSLAAMFDDSGEEDEDYDDAKRQKPEDDDEEEDEEEEEEDRPRKRARNQFLDVEAEVDEDEEEIEDEEDELGKEDGFIQYDKEEEERADDRLHREVDRQRAAIADEDAERLASEYREKYGRTATSKFRGDMAVVPQRLLVPSVNDPNIWGVRCRPGKEKAIVRTLWRKKASLDIKILSAFQRDSFQGYVYVEALRLADVEHAIAGVVNVYARQMLLVPIEEYTDLLRVTKTTDVELVPGAYVRVKRGKYQGDLAVVDDLSENGLEARLKLVPRLDYGRTDDRRKTRPAARLFSPTEARISDPKNWQQRQKDNHYVFQGEEYVNGYLIKDFRITHLITDVEPTLEEVTMFSHDDGIDLHSLVKKHDTTFQPGDHVEVHEGEQTGIVGRVVSIDRDIVSIKSDKFTLEVPSKSLRKTFNQGDHVRVIGGKYKDETGMVVRVKDDVVTIIGDLSMAELTVFSKDLKEASDIGGRNSLGKYQIHDLVQLSANNVACIIKVERDAFRVLDISGTAHTIMPSAISMKVDNKFSFATDRNGAELRVGDTVKEIDGDRRGVVLHIYRTFAFIHDRSQNDNAGVSLVRTRNVTAVASKRITETDLTKMNPMSQPQAMPKPIIRQGGRDRALNQTVKIRQGPYKGLLGIVKDTTDTVARVELHSKSKIISIEKTKLGFIDKQNKTLSYEEFMTPRSGTTMPQYQPSFGQATGGRTPAWAAGRTPAWADGSRTPAWADGGSRTPAWSGGKTPAWSGSKTPAWNPSSATPAWSGNKTPAWNPSTPYESSKTPGSYDARTPAWADDARTPWQDPSYGRTPGEWNAETPGNAYTPGVGGDWNANTPGAWNAPTPGYEPAEPE